MILIHVLPACGVRKNNGQKRIIGGEDAQTNEFPWMAALFNKSNVNVNGFFCGGSLISNHHVLTAAHCVHDSRAKDLVVTFGDHDISKQDETVHVEHEVKKWVRER